MSRITLISSDGHVAALMSDYRPYLESEYLEDFEAFLVDYAKYGVVTTDSTNITNRLDPEAAAEWKEKVGEGTTVKWMTGTAGKGNYVGVARNGVKYAVLNFQGRTFMAAEATTARW